MSWQDRPYNREDYNPREANGWGRRPGGGGAFGGGFNWSSMTGWLIILNVAVFVLDLMTKGTNQFGNLALWGVFSFDTAIAQGQVWRFLSFQFLHANFFHLLFNMIAIYFFGPMIEKYLGSRRYIAYYLICGVAGAIMYLLLFSAGILITSPSAQMVGASAGIFGILAGAAVIAPDTRVMLMFPPIPMKLRTMALVFLGISVFSVITNSQNSGGEAAHLGGAIAGFLLIRRANLLNFANRGTLIRNRPESNVSDSTPSDSMGKPASDRKSFSQRVSEYKSERDQKKQVSLEKEIDRILIKVKEQGLHSLTEGEKKTLQQETTRKRDA